MVKNRLWLKELTLIYDNENAYRDLNLLYKLLSY